MQSEPKSSQASAHRRASPAWNPNMEEGGWADRNADGGGSVTIGCEDASQLSQQTTSQQVREQSPRYFSCILWGWNCFLHSRASNYGPSITTVFYCSTIAGNNDPHGYFTPFMPDVPLLPPHKEVMYRRERQRKLNGNNRRLALSTYNTDLHTQLWSDCPIWNQHRLGQSQEEANKIIRHRQLNPPLCSGRQAVTSIASTQN